MTYRVTSLAGVNLTDVDTTAKVAPGTIVRGIDDTLGTGAEFMYLKGVANTAVGLVVIYDTYANTTTLVVAGSRGPAAVALAASVASTYGWYQISGNAVVKAAAAVAANAKVYATATPGAVDDAVVSGDQIDGAIFKTADGTPSAGYAQVQLSRPSLNGQG